MANHEAAINLLTEQRDYWISRIEDYEIQIASYKDNIICLRDEKEGAVVKVSQFEASIAALKSSSDH